MSTDRFDHSCVVGLVDRVLEDMLGNSMPLLPSLAYVGIAPADEYVVDDPIACWLYKPYTSICDLEQLESSSL